MKKIFLLMMTLLLSACFEKPPQPMTYAYLMQHPDELAKQYKQCETQKTANCELVEKAFFDFSNLFQDERQNPEGFGQRILEAELASQMAEDVLKMAQEAYTKQPTEEAQQVLARAEKAYQEKRDAVTYMLVVVGMGSPE
ncbi:MAG: EexN family lipoprotein [Gammaproteobacteria bacterium]